MKEWCSLKHTLRGKQTSLALEILRAMDKREEFLFQNKLFLAGVLVDARYRILLSEEQVELAKAGLLEVAFKARHCSVRSFQCIRHSGYIFGKHTCWRHHQHRQSCIVCL